MKSDEMFNSAIERMHLYATVLEPPYEIDDDQHQLDIQHMKRNIQNEYFFFVVNLEKANTEHTHGLYKWLGYDDASFTFKKYVHIMHPTQFNTFSKIAGSILQTIFSNSYHLEYLTHRFISNSALKHADGTFYVFKRICSPWQLDKNKKLVAYLNEFYLIGKYGGEGFNPRATNKSMQEGVEAIIENQVRSEIIRNPEEFLPFTPQQYRIVRILAYNPELTEDEVGALLSITGSTVHTHTKKLLPLARKHFSRKFKTVKEIAAFLKKEGVL